MMSKTVSKKTCVLFLDQSNEFVSQLAEYFTNQMFEDKYEVYSAGFDHDIIDCDMISVMYQNGEDMRRQVAKDLKDEEKLPKDDSHYDYVIYLQKPVFDKYADKSPWKGKQILVPMRLRSEYTATDDVELFDDYVKTIEEVKSWVAANMKDPENLKSLVSA